MKSLKPKSDKTSVIASINTLEKYDNDIEGLQKQITDNRESIDEIKGELESGNIAKESGTFDSVTTGSLKASRAVITDIDADTIKATDITSYTLSAVNISGTQAVVEKVFADDVSSSSIKASTAEADIGVFSQGLTTPTTVSEHATISSLNSDYTTVGTLTADKIKTESFEPDSIDTVNISSDSVDAGVVKAGDIDASSVTAVDIKSTKIDTQRHAFSDTFITLADATDSADNAADRFIELPAMDAGIYRLVFRQFVEGSDEDDIVASITYSNTEQNPLIQYDKAHDGELVHFYYHYDTERLYIHTQASGQVYWSYSDRLYLDPPNVYKELPVPIDECYRFNVSKNHGVVLMGDRTGSTALTVLGLIEGNFVRDDNAYVTPKFYSDITYDLFTYCRSYLRHIKDDGSYDYQRAEVYGYLYWKDESIVEGEPYYIEYEGATYDYSPTIETDDGDTLTVLVKDGELLSAELNDVEIDLDTIKLVKTTNYPEGMNPDHRINEALEKIEMVDDNTIILTIDDDHGQDEITLVWDDETDTQTSTMPFILGFDLRSEKVDYLFNHDMFEAERGVIGNDIAGY